MKEKLEPLDPIEEETPKEYTKKDKFKFALIYSLIFLGVPMAVGMPLTAALNNLNYIESLYIIFGAISMLAALFRGYRRDSKNYRKNHTVVEDHDSVEYVQYSFHQMVAYIVGIIAIGLGVGFFYLFYGLGLFQQTL